MTIYEAYCDFKARDPDCLYLFRRDKVGACEVFGESHTDLRQQLKPLNFATVSRFEGDRLVVSAVIPSGWVEEAITALVAAGHRVAVVEQVTEAPKGVTVERVVVEGRSEEDDR